MDAFFAAIEQLDQPELRGKPILVGHDGPRSVVSTASYEARPFGCHSAQPMAVAKRLCPQAIVVPIRGQRYRQVSQDLFSLLDEFAPLVEPLSIDEGFLDVSGSGRLFGTLQALGRSLKRRVADKLSLTASVGIAPNKYLAKLASNVHKPDGLTVIPPHKIDTVLARLPVTKIWGIGPASASKLKRMGVNTIGDLRQMPLDLMKRTFGVEAEHFGRLARGLDDRPVVPDSQAKSIGQEQTFDSDMTDPTEVRRVLLQQVEQVARRLRKHRLWARTVSLKIRFGQFQTISRSTTLGRPTEATTDLWRAAAGLLNTWTRATFQPVRLIGMAVKQLSAGDPQLELFAETDQQRQRRLDGAADQIVQRFGKRAIQRGGTLG